MPVKNNIILLHGWGASAQKLAPLARELSKKGWDTLALNLPGFTGEPPPPGEWGVGDYALWVLQKAKEEFRDEKFFVFGHSFGGRLAIKLAAEHPSVVRGTILCAAAGLLRTNPIKRLFFLVLAKLGKLLPFLPGGKRLANIFKTLLYKAAREHDYEKAQGMMREVFKRVIAEDLRPLLDQVRVPTLILWGEKDKMTPVYAAYLAHDKIKDSKLVIFPEEGHKLPYEKSKEIAQEINKWSNSLI